jgi:hypothetical protein
MDPAFIFTFLIITLIGCAVIVVRARRSGDSVSSADTGADAGTDSHYLSGMEPPFHNTHHSPTPPSVSTDHSDLSCNDSSSSGDSGSGSSDCGSSSSGSD